MYGIIFYAHYVPYCTVLEPFLLTNSTTWLHALQECLAGLDRVSLIIPTSGNRKPSNLSLFLRHLNVQIDIVTQREPLSLSTVKCFTSVYSYVVLYFP